MPVSTKKSGGNWVLAGPLSDPIPDLSGGIGVRFFESMTKNGDNLHHMEATTGETETKTSVKLKAIKIASLIKSRGIKEGHVVVISSKVHLDQTVALLACWFAGAIVAPLHSDYDYDDLKRSIKMLQPKCAFCESQSCKIFSRIFIEVNVRCPIIAFTSESKQFPIFRKCYETKEDPNFEIIRIAEPTKQPAIIISTLGTESNPKLVAVSHHNLFISCTMHILASCLCFDSTLKLIYFKHVTEKNICKYLQSLKIEHMFIDGQLAVNVAQNSPVTEFDLTSLKTIYVAGMPLTTTNYARVCKAFNRATVNTTYQTVETGMLTEVSQDVFTKNKQKVLSVGRLYAGVYIRVVDISTKEILGPEKQGEIQVKCGAVMLGYYKDPEATSKAFVKGYYRTGDIGSYDRDGYIYIKGRVSDQITRDSQTFAVQDIEDVIRLNPAVLEVACISYKDEIIACVIKKRGQEISANTLLEFIADVLPTYKLPTKVFFKDFFPKTVLGVVKKYVVKESIMKTICNGPNLIVEAVNKK